MREEYLKVSRGLCCPVWKRIRLSPAGNCNIDDRAIYRHHGHALSLYTLFSPNTISKNRKASYSIGQFLILVRRSQYSGVVWSSYSPQLANSNRYIPSPSFLIGSEQRSIPVDWGLAPRSNVLDLEHTWLVRFRGVVLLLIVLVKLEKQAFGTY